LDSDISLFKNLLTTNGSVHLIIYDLMFYFKLLNGKLSLLNYLYLLTPNTNCIYCKQLCIKKEFETGFKNYFADSLNIYPTVTSPKIHFTRKHSINRIESYNPTMHT